LSAEQEVGAVSMARMRKRRRGTGDDAFGQPGSVAPPPPLAGAMTPAEERLKWNGRGRRTGRRREKAAPSFSLLFRRWHEDSDTRR
jgi:hypothetical protein